ncbi:hypothetical protein [Tardiphaga robiniae]|uniref:Uncharacterized protein n=1 Tax=Tardiphaga robiniae TaxID=943830 RepID=A0A7G6TWZ1_9BRAD|nr:hypothetical protein [Tardiphaga robiniae]QND71273.1 hypothetical protein HB776_08500 [Tardiphaga robiniae]
MGALATVAAGASLRRSAILDIVARLQLVMLWIMLHDWPAAAYGQILLDRQREVLSDLVTNSTFSWPNKF